MTVTGTTIGFGDLGPTLAGTRVACIFYIPLAVAVIGECLGRVAGAYLEYKSKKLEYGFLARSMTLLDLDIMDTNKDGTVTEGEFLSYMLVALQKVEKEDVDEILTLFKKLDKDNSGSLDKRDLALPSLQRLNERIFSP